MLITPADISSPYIPRGSYLTPTIASQHLMSPAKYRQGLMHYATQIVRYMNFMSIS